MSIYEDEISPEVQSHIVKYLLGDSSTMSHTCFQLDLSIMELSLLSLDLPVSVEDAIILLFSRVYNLGGSWILSLPPLFNQL